MEKYWNLRWVAVGVLTGLVVPALGVDGSEGRPPRIGIISDQNMKAQVDLLMIEMQKQKVELVERDEIDKVMREHSLSIAGLTGQDSLKVGQLLKADGLILIEVQKKDSSLVRLVAVAPGVMIWYGDLSTKGNPETWSKTVVSALEPYVMKLSVKKGEAIPISLLPVKPAIGTTAAKQLTIDLNRLLLLQMVRKPSLFVLERENLRRVEEEQHFSGQVSEFWTGSYVVDAVAGHDLLDTNKVTLSLVVQPPQTGKRSTGTELREEGKADELPAVAARMCDKLCAFVGANTNTSGWDAKTEGRQFLALAGSLSNLEQKKTAYETAMALGCRDSGTAGLYREVLRNRLDKKGPWMSEFVVATRREVAEQGRQLLEMLEFHESYRPPEGFTADSERMWLYAYWQPLDDLGRFLEGVHKEGLEGEVGETLPTLRETGRRLVARTWLNDNCRLAARRHAGIASDGTRYFYSSAEDILRVLRTVGLPLCADSGNDAYLHHKPLLRRDAVEPVYPAVDTESESTREAMWRSFVEEAKSSDTPRVRLAYWSEQLTKATNENTRMRARGGLQLQLWTDLGYVVSNTTDLTSHIVRAYGDKSANRPESCFFGNNNEKQRALSLFLWMCGSKEVENRTLAEVGVPCLVQPYCINYNDPEMKTTIETLKQRADRDTDRDVAETVLATVRKLFGDARPGFDFNWVKRVRLDVTREYVLPGSQKEFDGTPPVYGGWRDGCTWFVFGNNIYSLNPDTRKVEEYGPVPLVKRRNTTTTAYGTRLAVTDDYLVYCITTRQFFPVKDFSCDLAVRRRDKRDWVTSHLPFVAQSPVQIDGKLYALIDAPDAVQTGLASFDSATLTFGILRDPGARLVEPHAKTGAVEFASLGFGFPLLATADELVGSWNRLSYGWNPRTGGVRSIPAGEAKALREAIIPYFHVCESFGFNYFDASPDIAYLRPNGAKQTIQVEIRTPRTVLGGWIRGTLGWFVDRDHDDCSELRESLPTQHSLLVPYASERGFCEIPYADIKAWLASNYTGFVVAPAKAQLDGK